MSRMRIGQVLEQMGKISGHDIDEILHEQSSIGARKTFGEIALTWGLCEPEHIWKAWANQLEGNCERVDLNMVGIDSQAWSRLPRELGLRLSPMPVRTSQHSLVTSITYP